MFAYCGNNPIARFDPTGEFFFTALGAVTGFIGSALTTAAINLITGSNNDVFTAGMYGAIGGAIAGAGVDTALVVIGSFGTALPVVALAGGIAFAAGGAGNALTTYLTSDGKASDQELNTSFWLGGFFNVFSLGLSSGAVSSSFTGVSIAGMQGFKSNLTSGLMVACSTSFATEVGQGNLSTTRSTKNSRMNYCYKIREF